MSQYLRVAVDESLADEAVELPTEEDGTLLLSVLVSQFEGATGLRYRNPSNGAWRALRVVQDVIYPPSEGWGDKLYSVVKSSPVQPPIVHTVDEAAQFGDGNKRKIDESGEDRAAKNPRHNLIEAPQPDYSVDKSSPDQFEPTPLEEVVDVDLEPPQFDLIVLGLAYKVEEDEMRRYFEQFGELQSVEVKKSNTGQSRGFGFVRFKSYKVQQAVAKEKHVIGGRTCEIKKSRKANHPPKLFIGHLPFFSSRENFVKELEAHFKRYGTVTDVYVPIHFRGFGFVTYEDGEDARRAASAIHEFRGKTLNVTAANPKKAETEEEYQEPYVQPDSYLPYGYSNRQLEPVSHLPLGHGMLHRTVPSARVPAHTMYVASGSSKGSPMFSNSQYVGYRSNIGRPEY